MKFRIKELREARGMTQEELAEKSGISRATICGLEGGGEKITTTKTLLLLANALNVPLDTLFYTPSA